MGPVSKPAGRRKKRAPIMLGLGLALMISLIVFAGQALAQGRAAPLLATATVSTAQASTNLAPLASVTASSQTADTGQLAVKAVDGIVAGYPGDYTKEWATASGKAGSWIRLRWANPVTLSRVVLYDRPNANDQITKATISFSDGTTVVTGALPNDGRALSVTFRARQVMWAQVTATRVNSTTVNVGLAEVKMLGTATAAIQPPSTTTTTVAPTTTTTRRPTTTTTRRPTTTTTLRPTTTTTRPPSTATTLRPTTATTVAPTTTTVAPTTTTTLAPTTTTTVAPSTTTTTVPSGGTVRVTSTLQAAINAAANGQTIYVPAGSWGTGVINGRSNLTIYGDGTASVVGTIEIGGASSNIVIHDLLIKDSYANDYNPNLAIQRLAGGHFYNLTFSGVGYACINAASTAAAGSSSYFTDVITNIEVDHNVCLEPIGNFGFYVGHGCANWNIHDNVLGPCMWKNEGPPHQFYIQDSHDITLTNNDSRQLDVPAASNGFAYKVGCGDQGQGHIYNVTLRGNKATGCYGGLWVVAAVDVLAENEQYLACTAQAVQFYADCNRVTVRNSTLNAPIAAVAFAKNTGDGWSANTHLTGNTAASSRFISLGGGPASMIVENSGNSWN